VKYFIIILVTPPLQRVLNIGNVRLPATGSRSPRIASRQCAMIGWHATCYWVAGDEGQGKSLLSKWRRRLSD